jgi:hypothetical protein
MPYTAANAITALDNAVAALRAERDLAVADAPAIAALLDQAANRVIAGRDRIRAATASASWTAERAAATLAAATPPIPATVDGGRAIVELATGGRLLIEGWAQAFPADPRLGFSVAIVGPAGETATRVRAADNPSLASIVARLYNGAS